MTQRKTIKIPDNVLLTGIMTRTPAAEAGSLEAGLSNFQISSPCTRLLDFIHFSNQTHNASTLHPHRGTLGSTCFKRRHCVVVIDHVYSLLPHVNISGIWIQYRFVCVHLFTLSETD